MERVAELLRRAGEGSYGRSDDLRGYDGADETPTGPRDSLPQGTCYDVL
jgi:hypothetical protein